MTALGRFGAPLDDVAASDFLSPDLILQIGVPPLRIDILTSIEGVAFDEAWPRRITLETDGLKIPVLSREQLLLNKRSTGRAKQLRTEASGG